MIEIGLDFNNPYLFYFVAFGIVFALIIIVIFFGGMEDY